MPVVIFSHALIIDENLHFAKGSVMFTNLILKRRPVVCLLAFPA
ncbi:MAG: hypothetical protein V2I32_06180 [Desulforhopalus sp.]|nr:hypothetical protein [Desulforhopalus sp.]